LRKRLTQDAPAEAAGIDPADSKPPKAAAHHGWLMIILGIYGFITTSLQPLWNHGNGVTTAKIALFQVCKSL
jgi:hypothetical protein